MIRVGRQARVVDPGEIGAFVELVGKCERVSAVTLASQAQRLEALEEEPGVERAHAWT